MRHLFLSFFCMQKIYPLLSFDCFPPFLLKEKVEPKRPLLNTCVEQHAGRYEFFLLSTLCQVGVHDERESRFVGRFKYNKNPIFKKMFFEKLYSCW